ncbi:unnamed protein product [Trifolium pratense]|uniref:Uncharacterized protein n=1 Tax=Trifolium pratense TaxID=57577 RepID=A0ACB0LV75_TRIPR|nr:unnamed protein product [Trifolium pratense]
MDINKIIRNSSNDVSFIVYGCLNIEEGNDYNSPLESKESNETFSSNTSTSSSSSSSFESLNDFSEHLVQLHIKRGLSKYYKEKSRTFRSLSDCKCLEDLSKKKIALKKKARSSFHSPKADISKKAGRSCFTSLLYKLN